MADNMVYRGTAGFGVGRVTVVQRRGITALYIDVVIVYQAVDFVGGDAGFDELCNVVQRFGGQTAELAHFFDFFGCFNDNGHVGVLNIETPPEEGGA